MSFSLKKFRLRRVWGRGNRQAEGGKAAPSELDFRRGAPFCWHGRRRDFRRNEITLSKVEVFRGYVVEQITALAANVVTDGRINGLTRVHGVAKFHVRPKN